MRAATRPASTSAPRPSPRTRPAPGWPGTRRAGAALDARRRGGAQHGKGVLHAGRRELRVLGVGGGQRPRRPGAHRRALCQRGWPVGVQLDLRPRLPRRDAALRRVHRPALLRLTTVERVRGTPDDANERYDVAFVTVESAARAIAITAGWHAAAGGPSRSASGSRRGRRTSSGTRPSRRTAGCTRTTAPGPAQPGGLGVTRTRCAMTAGDSGGPWFAGFSPRTGTGTIVAITTYKISANPRVLYATVLGPAARVLYQEADVSPDRSPHGRARNPSRSARRPNGWTGSGHLVPGDRDVRGGGWPARRGSRRRSRTAAQHGSPCASPSW